MNIERTSKVTIAITWKELFAALVKANPNETLLHGFLQMDAKNISVEPYSSGIGITGIRRSQGPAEIEFNRIQRRVEDGTE